MNQMKTKRIIILVLCQLLLLGLGKTAYGCWPSPQVKTVFQRIQTEALAIILKKKQRITFSIGVATFLRPPATVDAMIKVADDLMYLAKKAGKGQIKYEIYDNTGKEGNNKNTLKVRTSNLITH
jgi:GGDEF domain-containing protein